MDFFLPSVDDSFEDSPFFPTLSTADIDLADITWSNTIPEKAVETLDCLDPSLLSIPHSTQYASGKAGQLQLDSQNEIRHIILQNSPVVASHLPGEVQEFEKTCMENAAARQARRRRRRPIRQFDQDSSSDSQSSNSAKRGNKRRKTRFTNQQRDVLNSWLTQNRHHPYPSLAEKEEIASSTGLSKRQIEVWYSNARKRYEKAQNPLTFVGQKEISIYDGQTPLERYLSSEDEEPAHPDAIACALAKSTQPSLDSFPHGEFAPTVTLSSSTMTGTCSPSELRNNPCTDQTTCAQCKNCYPNPSYASQDVIEPSTADDNSFESAWHEECSSIPTIRSMSSIASGVSFGSRQGRRRHGYHSPAYGQGLHRPQSEPQMASLGNCLQHFCTLCSKAFKSASDRRRHENSIHSGAERWICKLHEIRPPSSLNGVGGLLQWRRCTELSEEKRTFYRKDKLLQHLRNTHRLGRESVQELPLNGWVSGPFRVRLSEMPSVKSPGNLQDTAMEESRGTVKATVPSAGESYRRLNGLHPSAGKDLQMPNVKAESVGPTPNTISRRGPPAKFILGASSGEEDDSSPEDLNASFPRRPSSLTQAAKQMSLQEPLVREPIWVNASEKGDAFEADNYGSDVVMADEGCNNFEGFWG